MLISVIVPVYNVEKFLRRCLDSLITQKYKSLEIILVDDGSTDNSGLICDEYSKLDNRIVVIHKLNSGLSSARNTGLNFAKGDFVSFVDSDDYIENDVYSRISSILNKNLDVILLNGIKIDIYGKTTKLNDFSLIKDTDFNGLDYMINSIKNYRFKVPVWLNLYNREFLINNKLFFKEQRLHEDEEWTPRVFFYANNIKIFDVNYYYYILRENSITMSKNKLNNTLNIFKTCYELDEFFEKNLLDKKKLKIVKGYIGYIYLGAIYISKDNVKEYRDKISKKFIFDKVSDKKMLFKVILFLISIDIYIYINTLSKK